MTGPQLKAILTRDLAERRLLDHPFYVRWQAGELSLAELGGYAEQYRYFESSLPSLLRDLLDRLGDTAAADLVRRNLADEEGVPAPHVELFADFAMAAGAADDVDATDATRRLIGTYHELIAAGAAEGLAAVVAYEMQAPEIAASKASGLRARYGLDSRATRFWDVHATMDRDHSDWSIDALACLGAPAATVVSAARRSLDAWWAFLDEREAGVSRAAA